MVMTDQEDHKARLEALERRLAAKREAMSPKPHMEEHYSQAQHAWRMVVELVAGLGIGFVIGYGMDMLIGTSPSIYPAEGARRGVLPQSRRPDPRVRPR